MCQAAADIPCSAWGGSAHPASGGFEPTRGGHFGAGQCAWLCGRGLLLESVARRAACAELCNHNALLLSIVTGLVAGERCTVTVSADCCNAQLGIECSTSMYEGVQWVHDKDELPCCN